MNNDTMQTMQKDAFIQVKISKELQKALQELAQVQGLPVSKLVLTSLAEKYPELVPIILKH
jgi:uncharacterized protein (DUF1778 family)